MAILNNSNAISTAGGYDINNSLRFRSSASAYLSRTPGSAGSQTTWTWSAWIKLGSLAGTSTQNLLVAGSNVSSNKNFFLFFGDNGNSGSNNFGIYASVAGVSTDANIQTTQVFRDPSAWYHIVVVMDTTQATASNRIKIYVNGNQVTSFLASTYCSQNYTTAVNNNVLHTIGRYTNVSANPFDGYLADVNLIDGQALTPSSFGETDTTTGVWKPKAYSGTYGTNGFYLKFSDIATTSGSNAGLGKDFSGNSNYWTTNNISVTAGTTYDAMLDVPTNTSATVANYATLNPLDNGGLPVAGGNLNLNGGTAAWYSIRSTIAFPSTGKYYWEYTVNDTGTNIVGILDANGSQAANAYVYGTNQYGYGWQCVAAVKGNNNVTSAYGSATAAGDVIMIAFDADNRSLFVGKNGTWFNSSNPATNTSPMYSSIPTTLTFFPVFAQYSTTTSATNFGQRPFTYTPPTGFVRLNTYNLPDSTIKKGNTVMDATTYSGTSAVQSITNAGAFRPDLVWIKCRSVSNNNSLFDSVRGATGQLFSNLTNAEAVGSDGFTSFNSNGFSLDNSGSGGNVNVSGRTYVAWQWQAGQGTNTSNTSGSITSTVSVNATAGFSVVTWTGNGTNGTIGHGLGVAPKMIIAKIRSTTDNWLCYHSELGATKYINLNLTNAATTSAGPWNNTAPTPSVFSVSSTTVWLNNTGSTYVAYCWADVSGFSKAFSYTGNGNADGPMVYLGFRPKFILYKNSSSGTAFWRIFDTSRATYNTVNNALYPNSSIAEDTGSGPIDILSNGFKIRTSQANDNNNGDTIIGIAFAENPFKNSNAR